MFLALLPYVATAVAKVQQGEATLHLHASVRNPLTDVACIVGAGSTLQNIIDCGTIPQTNRNRCTPRYTFEIS